MQEITFSFLKNPVFKLKSLKKALLLLTISKGPYSSSVTSWLSCI